MNQPVCRNIADFLPRMALERPHAPAIIVPHARDAGGRVAYTHFTYTQLARDCDAIAHGLYRIGLRRGDRCALMVKPGLDFFALMFALFKAGVVPVLIDPGIGMRPLKACLDEVAPRGFIGIAVAQLARRILGWARRSIEISVTVGGGHFGRGWRLTEVRALGSEAGPMDAVLPEQDNATAAVLFTSGSTGIPKGVIYTHANFIAQVEMIRQMFGITPGEIDVPTFPPFALFDPALGMTAVIPDMDPRYPARVNPDRIYEALEDFGGTNMFGSPGLLNTLSRDGVKRGRKLPTLRRVISAGAPALPATLERMQRMLAQGVEVFTPYGATECMPVCLIGSREVLANRQRTHEGHGLCVGHPVAGMRLAIVPVSDAAMPEYEDGLALPAGQIGEIVVHGPTVTQSYFGRDRDTALAKMRDAEGRLYHRMGDLGYLDAEGRLWFCGRKSHRVETANGTLFTIPCEGVFNAHPAVFRTALVGVGKPGQARPVICVELDPEAGPVVWLQLASQLRELGAKFPHTRGIADFLLHPGFPVDIRHNAKIRREVLAQWATQKIGRSKS